MSRIAVNGAVLHYEDRGSGSETIVFAHGLLLSGRMFAAQVEALSGRYRTITFDFRGQGRSEVTRDGYDMDTLTEDTAALVEALDAAPCHFVGLSMGGFVGMRLAARRPELLRSLVLLETSAEPEQRENLPRYRLLTFLARWLGPAVVAGRIMPILFGREFLEDPARAEERELWRRHIAGNHRVGISRAAKGVTERAGVESELASIALPTLIVVGEQDVATVPARAERMHRLIRDSKLVVLPGAGHSSTIEEPAAVNRVLEEFLSGAVRGTRSSVS